MVVIYGALNSNCCYTFSDVRIAAERFGQGLIEQWKWEKGEVFNIFATNNIDIGPLIYGILYAGGVTSPANPNYSVEELAYQLTNSVSTAIATDIDHLGIAKKAATKAGIHKDRIVLVGGAKDGAPDIRHWKEIVASSQASHSSNLRPKVDSDKDLSFLVYSSGTMGLPKGVMLSHRNIISDISLISGSVGKWYKSGADKILSVLPFFHIYGLTGLVHQPLHCGIESVVMPTFELQSFLEAIQNHKITFAYIAPPVIVKMVRDPTVPSYDLRSAAMVTCGAAPLSRELVDMVYQKYQIKVNQAYGLSETSPMTYTQPWNEWYKSVGSVGKLFPNMTAKIMSQEGKEVGIDQQGKLWLAGPNVFKGYWNNSQATIDSIITDGFFKTGDVGFISQSNDLYITDRLKEIIKYQGYQVAPAELEGKLLDYPDIVDVAVIGIYDSKRMTEVPRAYIVAREGKDDYHCAEATMQWIAERVVYYKKLRGGVRFIDKIPKSAFGKILRRVLSDQAKQEVAPACYRSKI